MTSKMKKAIVAAVVAVLAVYGVTVNEDVQEIVMDLFETEQSE